MSRHIVTNDSDFSRIIGDLFTNPENVAHRYLIILEMAPHGWLKAFAQTQSIVCITSDSSIDQSDQVTALLGSEHSMLAYELSDPMDASLLAALAGTVTCSGALILSVPFALNNPDSLVVETGDIDSLAIKSGHVESHPVTNQQNLTTSRFVHRFIRLLAIAKKHHTQHIVIASYQPDNEQADKPKSRLIPLHAHHARHMPNGELAVAMAEQNELLQRACAQLANNNSVCISIIGKRGRGKSALTARIANWLYDQNISYCITSVHPSALSTFHAMTHHPSDKNFLPMQQLHASTADTLLVDEASNISLTMLKALMQRHDKLILCTTVEGYESSGRAFELRLQSSIKNHFNSQLLLRPKHPWRWIAEDPIETLIDSLVLNESRELSWPTPPTLTSNAELTNKNNVHIRSITQQQLLNNEHDLKNVFGLLRDTHYQTSVKDLQHLLDGKNVLLWVLEDKQTLIISGVLLLTLELAIEPSLHKAIVRKQRRLPHHLLAQLLAQTANMTQPLNYCFARVVRISVARHLRRQGFGSWLLTHVENVLLNEHSTLSTVDAIGASFASDSTSVEFWRSNGYATFHKGYRKNPRTGENAEAVLKSHNATVCESLQNAVQILDDNQRWRLSQANAHTPGLNPLTTSDAILLRQFAKGYRSAHDTYAALSRLSLHYPIKLQMNQEQSRKQFEKKLREQVASALNNAPLSLTIVP